MGYRSYRYELINNSGYVLTITLGSFAPFNLNPGATYGPVNMLDSPLQFTIEGGNVVWTKEPGKMVVTNAP